MISLVVRTNKIVIKGEIGTAKAVNVTNVIFHFPSSNILDVLFNKFLCNIRSLCTLYNWITMDLVNLFITYNYDKFKRGKFLASV